MTREEGGVQPGPRGQVSCWLVAADPGQLPTTRFSAWQVGREMKRDDVPKMPAQCQTRRKLSISISSYYYYKN